MNAPPRSGLVELERRLIAPWSALEANGRVAVLVHELAHVHGVRDQGLRRTGPAVVAETAAHIARPRASAPAQAIPYVAGWAPTSTARITFGESPPREPGGHVGDLPDPKAPTGAGRGRRRSRLETARGCASPTAE